MAGMVPVTRSNALTDPTLAANVNKSLSASQRAVDDRVREGAAPGVADALSNDPSIRDRIRQYAEDVIDVGTLTAANISHDTDGTPYYDPGSRTFKLGFDFDGTPYYTT